MRLSAVSDVQDAEKGAVVNNAIFDGSEMEYSAEREVTEGQVIEEVAEDAFMAVEENEPLIKIRQAAEIPPMPVQMSPAMREPEDNDEGDDQEFDDGRMEIEKTEKM